jgi:hypothetical protein
VVAGEQMKISDRKIKNFRFVFDEENKPKILNHLEIHFQLTVITLPKT